MVQSGQSRRRHAGRGLYENNRVTDSIGVGASYAATAKIGANAGVRYSRAKLASVAIAGGGSQAVPDTTDSLTSAYLGANYAINRSWSAACNVSHDSRRVSGGLSFHYTDNAVGCLAQFLWQ